MELVDDDKDGVYEYKFTRLFHNGTSSAIETMILKADKNKIQRVTLEYSWFGKVK